MLVTFISLIMELIADGIYRQDYYSKNFFIMTDVCDVEVERLIKKDIIVIDYYISIGEKDNEPLFYLHLYFKGINKRILNYKELFGNY